MKKGINMNKNEFKKLLEQMSLEEKADFIYNSKLSIEDQCELLAEVTHEKLSKEKLPDLLTLIKQLKEEDPDEWSDINV